MAGKKIRGVIALTSGKHSFVTSKEGMEKGEY
jgi:hypothetical protein